MDVNPRNKDFHELPSYDDAVAKDQPYYGPCPVQAPPLPQMYVYGYDQPDEDQPSSQVQQVNSIPGIEGQQITGLEPEKRPPDWTDWTVPAVFVCLCCSWPLGIFAIWHAQQAKIAYRMGDYLKAEEKAQMAKGFTIVSLFAGIIAITFTIFFIFVVKNRMF